MMENIGTWPTGHGKTEKSGHRLAAERTLFPRRWVGDMVSASPEVIREMPDKLLEGGGAAVSQVTILANGKIIHARNMMGE